MTKVSLSKILIDDGPGELRAVVVDQDGKAWRSFLQRWEGERTHARFGQTIKGRLRAIAEEQGGYFVELDSGEEVFLANHQRQLDLTIGAGLNVEILSESRHGKLARAKQVQELKDPVDPLSYWRKTIPGGEGLPCETDRSAVSFAFEEAMSEQLTLPGGGRVFIEQTRALTAIDLDSGGRQSKGSAGARALSINLEAVTLAARQLALRNLGGAAVIDCISPINLEAGKKIQQRFLDAFKSVSRQLVQALPPSKFGLMEIAIAWGSRPMQDHLLSPEGELSAESTLLEAFRTLQDEARRSPAVFFDLWLPKPVYSVYSDRQTACEKILQTEFSGRVQIVRSDQPELEIKKR